MSPLFDWDQQPVTAGPLVLDWEAELAAIAAGLPATETWSVPDSAGSLNGDHGWVDYIGSHGWSVVGQAAQLASAGGIAHGGRMVVDLQADDYLVQVAVAEFFDTGVGLLSAGPCVRMQGDTSLTFYAAALSSLNGVGAFNLFRFLAGVQTTLATVAATPASGMVLGLRPHGNLLVASIFGVPRLIVTDAGIPTGRFAGIQGIANTGNRIRLDSLQARALPHSPLDLLSLKPTTGAH